MAIPKTNISLLAVRDGCDRTGQFSLRNNPRGVNKATWDASATPLKLTEFAGNVLGLQEVQDSKRSRANYEHVGPSGTSSIVDGGADSQLKFPNKPSATKMIYGKNTPSQYAQDTYCEMRHFGKHTGGQHRVEVHVCKKNNNSGLHYSKIAVICHQSGWFSGGSTLVLNDEWGYSQSWIKYEKLLDLPADKPFVTVIIYCVSPANSDSFAKAEVQYNCLQLTKT